jgi:hypothetical protein
MEATSAPAGGQQLRKIPGATAAAELEPRGEPKIKFKLLKTGPRLLPVGSSNSLMESAMTAIVPRENESNPVLRRMLLAIAAACALLATSSEGFAYDGPTFRSGLWKFERTLETTARQMIGCKPAVCQLPDR